MVSGTLYLAATPFYNKLDISDNLRYWLENADIIATENYNETIKLLTEEKITHKGEIELFGGFPFEDYNYIHGELGKHRYILSQLKLGKNVIIIVDEGQAGIGDPGALLAMDCILNHNIDVRVISGPSMAVIPYLMSGFTIGSFIFHGSMIYGITDNTLSLLKNGEYPHIFLTSVDILNNNKSVLINVLEDRKCYVLSNYETEWEKQFWGTISEIFDKIDKEELRDYITLCVSPPSEILENLQKWREDKIQEGTQW